MEGLKVSSAALEGRGRVGIRFELLGWGRFPGVREMDMAPDARIESGDICCGRKFTCRITWVSES